MESDRIYEFGFGPLRLLAHRVADECRIRWNVPFERANEEPSAGTSSKVNGALHEEPRWNRYVVGHEDTPWRFEPVMPDRPVVARPEETIGIPAGREARLHVAVPVWIRIHVGQGESAVVLCEVPSTVLSKTWFGETHSGELCYSLEMGLCRESSAPTVSGHLVTCSVDVRNVSREALVLQRICLRVLHLSIYGSDEGLRAGRTLVKYRGTERATEVTHDLPPREGSELGARFSTPRLPEESSVVRKTFSHFRSWLGG